MNKKEIEAAQDMDFQIRFIEAVLEKTPGFIEALIALGDLYTKRGLHQKRLKSI